MIRSDYHKTRKWLFEKIVSLAECHRSLVLFSADSNGGYSAVNTRLFVTRVTSGGWYQIRAVVLVPGRELGALYLAPSGRLLGRDEEIPWLEYLSAVEDAIAKSCATTGAGDFILWDRNEASFVFSNRAKYQLMTPPEILAPAHLVEAEKLLVDFRRVQARLAKQQARPDGLLSQVETTLADRDLTAAEMEPLMQRMYKIIQALFG